MFFDFIHALLQFINSFLFPEMKEIAPIVLLGLCLSSVSQARAHHYVCDLCVDVNAIGKEWHWTQRKE